MSDVPSRFPSAAISDLMRFRAGLLDRVAALETERSALLRQVRTLEAGMRVVDPAHRIERPRLPTYVQIADENAWREIPRQTLRTLRLNRVPMTVPEIVQTLMAERGIATTDRVYREALRQKVGLHLRKQALKARPVVRRAAGSDERQPKWELVSLAEVRESLRSGGVEGV